MPIRSGEAVWNGSLKEGTGKLETESGALKEEYSFGSRFQEGTGTNPEELIAAAHAGCYSMALSLVLGHEGYTPTKIKTTAKVAIDPEELNITKSSLKTEASVPDISKQEFHKIGKKAKKECPVTKALKGVNIELTAKLL
jgi:osmotically inducible protein OsmC